MSSIFKNLLDPELVVMVLAAVAAFATVASFVLPLLTGDRLGTRMKYVSSERDRLRAERLTRMADEQRNAKLRRDHRDFRFVYSCKDGKNYSRPQFWRGRRNCDVRFFGRNDFDRFDHLGFIGHFLRVAWQPGSPQ